MSFLSDILLAAAAFGAGLYCLVLSRRLRNLTTLESGIGGAVAVLSAQVDDLTKVLQAARQDAGGASARLDGLTRRAEQAAARLEVMLASLTEMPEPPPSRRVLRRRAEAAAGEKAA